ncbi:MarR family transcriptional regulator [Paenibacillus harenae]|uniref:Transcriptional regulator n=1 Tax=Paenibacillus harenae TaxID=306543 RepID=A0ABT9TUN5_PAEHA|nr:winged helix-turn-helix transcriptional regulator [Paenibacillus harenae]MDQ0061079.1 putative transcriptional regulator [Paenibacillus harenae]MDQ0111048.1 putative transcriptional regulator [Paenibacillus harenae]
MAQTSYRTGKEPRQVGLKLRSQRSKYRILQLLSERETVTSKELAELLDITVQEVNKAALSLTASGLIMRGEEDGQCMSITDNGIRVWAEVKREGQRRLERFPDPDIAGELEPVKDTSTG